MCPRTAICIIIDGVGVGELNDAALYNDQGSDTLGNPAHAVGGLTVPNLECFGFGAISTIAGVHWVMSTAERDFRSSILLKTANIHAVGIGKIDDLFCGRGLSEAIHAHTNAEVIEAVIEVQRHRDGGFIFANRVEFDMLYGHRNDPRGFADALEYFDGQLPRITETLDDGDLLLLTADPREQPRDAKYRPFTRICAGHLL